MTEIKSRDEFLDHIIYRMILISFSQHIKKLKKISAIILLCKAKEDSFNILIVHQSSQFSNSLVLVYPCDVFHKSENQSHLRLIFKLIIKDAYRKSLCSESIGYLNAVLIASSQDGNISISQVSEDRLIIHGISHLVLLIIKDIPKLGCHCRIYLRGVLSVGTLCARLGWH